MMKIKYAGVAELAQARDLKSLGAITSNSWVRIPSPVPDLYVFQFLWNGLNRNDRFGSFKCANYHLIWPIRLEVRTVDLRSTNIGSNPV